MRSESPSGYSLPEGCNHRAKQMSFVWRPFNRSQVTRIGRARVIAANTKYGGRSRTCIGLVKSINDELKQTILECRREGLVP